MRNRRIDRLLTLLSLTILLIVSSCTIERVDVSIADPFGLSGGDDSVPPVLGPDGKDTMPCWPDKTAMAAEIRGHGYSSQKPAWVATADWFRRLEPLAESLPACD